MIIEMIYLSSWSDVILNKKFGISEISLSFRYIALSFVRDEYSSGKFWRWLFSKFKAVRLVSLQMEIGTFCKTLSARFNVVNEVKASISFDTNKIWLSSAPRAVKFLRLDMYALNELNINSSWLIFYYSKWKHLRGIELISLPSILRTFNEDILQTT